MYREISLDSAVLQFADCAWLLKPDPEEAKAARPILPDGHTDLVLSVGNGVQIFGPASTVRFVPKDQTFLGIRFRLGAAGTMAGVAMDELLDRSVSLQVIWGALGREIEERVLAEPQPDRMLAILARALTARISNGLMLDLIVRRTACQLQRFPNTPVRKLAGDVGLSERQLLRRFEREVGLSVRRLGRILRFQGLLDDLRASRRRADATSRDWAGLAQDYGYADQAHLIRESRALAGVTPAALLQTC
jgi:AraC-like DNA-binding protein